MARQILTKTAAPGAYAGSWTEVTFTAADASNKEQFALTGKELLLMRNTSADTNYYVTIESTATQGTNRESDITEVDIPFGDVVVWGPTALDGWQQTDRNLYLEAENAAIEFAVITLP